MLVSVGRECGCGCGGEVHPPRGKSTCPAAPSAAEPLSGGEGQAQPGVQVSPRRRAQAEVAGGPRRADRAVASTSPRVGRAHRDRGQSAHACMYGSRAVHARIHSHAHVHARTRMRTCTHAYIRMGVLARVVLAVAFRPGGIRLSIAIPCRAVCATIGPARLVAYGLGRIAENAAAAAVALESAAYASVRDRALQCAPQTPPWEAAPPRQ